MSQVKKPPYKAFVVKEYGEGKSHWTEVGVVWKHNNGDGFNLDITEGLAISGRIVILPPKDRADEA